MLMRDGDGGDASGGGDRPSDRLALDARLRTRARLSRLYRTMLIVSLVIHSFFLPTPWTKAILALSVASQSKDLTLVPLDDEAILPMEIELIAAAAPPAIAPPPSPGDGVATAGSTPPTASSAPGPKPLPDAGRKDEPLDAGVPDAAVADASVDGGTDAGLDGGQGLDASIPDASVAALADASVDASAPASTTRRPPPDAGDGSALDGGVATGATSGQPPTVPPIRDPIGIAGKAGSIAGKDPNVSILLSMDLIRTHPSGHELGPVFAVLPIWKHFFVGSGVDPVKDLDRILVAGPQFRESSKVVAAVKLKLPEDKIKAVLEGIRLRATPAGSWESENVMLATVDGTPRVFVMQGSGVLLVVPESLGETARKMKSAGFPGAKGEAIVVFLKSPGKALRGMPFTIPQTLKWVRLAASLGADGSATVRIDCLDESTDAAEKSAELLTAGLEAATTSEVPLLGKVRMIDEVLFRAAGDHVQATLKLNPAQTRELAKIAARGSANLGATPGAPPGAKAAASQLPPRRRRRADRPSTGPCQRSLAKARSAASASSSATHSVRPTAGTSTKRQRPRIPGKTVVTKSSAATPSAISTSPDARSEGEAARAPSTR